MDEHPMVLIVDDDQLHLMLMKQIFKKAGIRVSCAANGEEALQEMGRHSFRCMITDLNMPRMNGLELARKTRQLTSGMPIVLCTGEEPGAAIWGIIDKEIDAVFRKPVDCSEILALVIKKVRRAN